MLMVIVTAMVMVIVMVMVMVIVMVMVGVPTMAKLVMMVVDAPWVKLVLLLLLLEIAILKSINVVHFRSNKIFKKKSKKNRNRV